MSTLFFIIPSRVECSCTNTDSYCDDHEEQQDGKVHSKHAEHLFYTELLGVIPELMGYLFYKITEDTQEKKATKKLKAPPTLLNWKVVNERMPWNIVLLLGGGFALASGSEVKRCFKDTTMTVNVHSIQP